MRKPNRLPTYNPPLPSWISVGHPNFSPTDGFTYYFANIPASTPTTTLAPNVIYLMTRCKITGAYIVTYSSGAAGTAEDVSLYVRVNNTTNYLIQTVGVAAIQRDFSNVNMNVPLEPTDFISIIMVCPTWETNPTNWKTTGFLRIEEV